MKKGMLVFGCIFLMLILVVNLSFVVAVDTGDFDDNPELLACRDKCKIDYDSEEDRSKCISGCKSDFGFIDDFEDENFRCEDMTQDQCELTDACEGIFESLPCEGEVCTTDTSWQGCRYEGDEFFEDYKDEKIKQKAGTNPGSPFYFIDKFFDKFGDQLEVKEERIAEIKAMVEAGDLENAKIALKGYMELADELEHEIDPEQREEAKRSAAAIRAVMKDIRDELPPGERGKFVSEIMSKEHLIATSAEISGKIKELCIQLAELDPLEYDKMCRTDDDAPKWKKKLDRELSADQEKTAKQFVSIMKQCFKTSGQDCACEDIPFYDFSIACSKAAFLATACDVGGDEIACDELENLDMPELPDWLQPIWENLEGDMNEAQYDMHMPKECVEAGATSPKECTKVMIKTGAPLECRAPLLESGCDNERECREICEKIMFELHAPQQCIDKGIINREECAEFMDNFRGPIGSRDGKGPRGPDCTRIEDHLERLECYDNKGNEFGDYYGPGEGEMPEGEITWQCKEHRIHWPPDCETFMREELPKIERQKMEEGEIRREQEGDWREKEKECKSKCNLEIEWWDYRNGECICYATEGPGPREGGWSGDDWEGDSGCDDCSSQCPAGAYTDCVNNRCVCGDFPDTGPQYRKGEGPGEPGDYDNSGEPPSTDLRDEGEGTDPRGTDSESTDGSESSSDSVDTEPSSDDSGGDAGITGNAFLEYYNN